MGTRLAGPRPAVRAGAGNSRRKVPLQRTFLQEHLHLNSAAKDKMWTSTMYGTGPDRSTSVADDGDNGFWTLSHAIWNSCSILTYLLMRANLMRNSYG